MKSSEKIKINTETRAGEIFVEKYNQVFNLNYKIERLNQREKRSIYEFPDLIFAAKNYPNLEVEVLSLWDGADKETKIEGKGSVSCNRIDYFKFIKQEILKKNSKCDILLIDAYCNRWNFNLELKEFDDFYKNDFDLKVCFSQFYKEVWIVDGDKRTKKIFNNK